MIIEAVLNLILAFLRLVLLPVRIENIPSDILTVLATLTGYLIEGGRVLAAYTHAVYLTTLLAFVVSLSVIRNTWRFIRFVLRKIPFINVE